MTFDGDKMAQLLRMDDAGEAAILVGVIKILKIVIEEPNKQFYAYVPEIVKFANYHGAAVLESGSDIAEIARPAFLELVQSIIVNHWKHFFPITIGLSRPVSPDAEVVRSFDSLMTILLKVFQSTSMDLLK